MEKYIFDQSNGLWYELQGDYYIPCLVLDEAGTSPIGMCIGMWGRKHQQYLKEHRPVLYSDLVLSGKLHSYLADIDTQARNKLHLLITQLAEKEGINEQLKAQDQMAWVGAMNNIRNRAEEIILCCRRASLSENRRRCVSEAAEVIWRKQNRVKEWP